jgi:hypothetical protein
VKWLGPPDPAAALPAERRAEAPAIKLAG